MLTGAGCSCDGALKDAEASAEDDDSSDEGSADDDASGEVGCSDDEGCSDDDADTSTANEDAAASDEEATASDEEVSATDDDETDVGADDASLDAVEAEGGTMEYDSDDAADGSALDSATLLDDASAPGVDSALEGVSLPGATGATDGITLLDARAPPGDASLLEEASALDETLLAAPAEGLSLAEADDEEDSSEIDDRAELSSDQDELSSGTSDVMSGARLICAASVTTAEADGMPAADCPSAPPGSRRDAATGWISAAIRLDGGSCRTARAVPPTTVTTPGTSHFQNVPAILPPKRRRSRFACPAIAEAPIQENRPIQLFIGDS